MIVLLKLRKILHKHFADLRWHGIAIGIAAYVTVSWLALWLSGEKDLVYSENFLYWLIVTASTVGYGDFSPSTTAGKHVVAFLVIPFGLGLFALVVGRLATVFAHQWRKGVKGLKVLNVENHILVLGWNGQRTQHLLKLLLREQHHRRNPQAIVLYVTADMENPLPGEVDFIKARSFTAEDDLERACLATASCIIIDNDADDVTLTTALCCSKANPNAHIIAYFKEEHLSKLLKQHCPNVECMPSVAVEMIAKAAADPGSSLLHHQLLDVNQGMTQYSVQYPAGAKPLSVSAVFNMFKQRYDATLIGVANTTADSLVINPPLSYIIEPKAIVYYIADERINTINWEHADVQ